MSSEQKCVDAVRTEAQTLLDSVLIRPSSPAVKFDDNKPMWHLFPWDGAEVIVQVLNHGAKKYAPRNWEKGMDWSRCFSACIRHLQAWWHGESVDPESGISHLGHAGCCLLFLAAYEKRGHGTDDRPKIAPYTKDENAI